MDGGVVVTSGRLRRWSGPLVGRRCRCRGGAAEQAATSNTKTPATVEIRADRHPSPLPTPNTTEADCGTAAPSAPRSVSLLARSTRTTVPAYCPGSPISTAATQSPGPRRTRRSPPVDGSVRSRSSTQNDLAESIREETSTVAVSQRIPVSFDCHLQGLPGSQRDTDRPAVPSSPSTAVDDVQFAGGDIETNCTVGPGRSTRVPRPCGVVTMIVAESTALAHIPGTAGRSDRAHGSGECGDLKSRRHKGTVARIAGAAARGKR